jgi:hypothetical protein
VDILTFDFTAAGDERLLKRGRDDPLNVSVTLRIIALDLKICKCSRNKHHGSLWSLTYYIVTATGKLLGILGKDP